MMLGRAALAHLRHSFQQHGQIRSLETSKSTEQLSTKTTKLDVEDRSMSTSSSSGIVGSQRRKSVSSKSRRSSRTLSPSSRRSSSVSTHRRLSTSSAAIVDTDDDGVVIVNDDKRRYFDSCSTFEGKSSSKFDLLHAVRYKLEHNEIGRATAAEKRRLCSVLGDHLRCGDADLILYSAQVEIRFKNVLASHCTCKVFNEMSQQLICFNKKVHLKRLRKHFD
jgi:hypothetical protein